MMDSEGRFLVPLALAELHVTRLSPKGPDHALSQRN
jgi:hypothetical protein